MKVAASVKSAPVVKAPKSSLKLYTPFLLPFTYPAPASGDPVNNLKTIVVIP
jgi:hypothetical protein